MMLGWHFVGDELRGGGRVPRDGEVLRHRGSVEIYKRGLHASVNLGDALQYAQGDTICRVECGGTIAKDIDNFVSTERRILWRVKGTELLRQFARLCALDVGYLWGMPDDTRHYLESGDPTLIYTIGAANAAAGLKTTDAPGATIRAAAGAAIYAAGKLPPWDAASAAARAASWAIAWHTSHGNVRDEIAWRTSRRAQNQRLTRMVEEARQS